MTLEEYDAAWMGDLGATLDQCVEVGDDCVPACSSDFHLC